MYIYIFLDGLVLGAVSPVLKVLAPGGFETQDSDHRQIKDSFSRDASLL